jgi:GTP-binding protein
LAELPRLLCLSKSDLLPPDELAAAVRDWQQRVTVPVFATSAATGAGTAELRDSIFELVPPEAETPPVEQPATHRVYRPGEGESFTVERVGPGAFRVEGGRVDRLIARHDTDNEDALRYVEERLRAIGVIRALEAAGFEPGDDVEIGGVVFELDPGAPPMR